MRAEGRAREGREKGGSGWDGYDQGGRKAIYGAMAMAMTVVWPYRVISFRVVPHRVLLYPSNWIFSASIGYSVPRVTHIDDAA